MPRFPQERAEAAVTDQAQLLQQPGKNISIDGILRSLSFPEIAVRQYNIDNAAVGTFGWIFAQASSPFRQWLQSTESLFWITGKAGSGKSTLLKYLSKHGETIELLKQWSGASLPVRVVDVYFWYLGCPIQKSEEGFLRTLLLQMLQIDPELFPLALAERWRGNLPFPGEPNRWQREELTQALNLIANLPRLSFKACIFIDGLDEYIGEHGSYHGLIQMVQKLASSPNFKVCVSSRPWPVFEAAFGNMHDEDIHNAFYLEDLTRDDIRSYIDSQLAAFLPGCEDPQELTFLEEDIACKAEGVFLWVFLVVKSVIRGLEEGDSVGILRRRVEDFPSDLDAYFGQTILSRVDKFYRNDTAKALKIAMLTCQPGAAQGMDSSFVDFWFLRQGNSLLQNEGLPTNLDPQMYPEAKFDSMVLETRRYISSCTKDLLYIPRLPTGPRFGSSYNCQVEYLHRTVYDFLSGQNIHDQIEQAVPMLYKRNDLLRRISLARLTVIPTKSSARSEQFRNAVQRVLGPSMTDRDLQDCLEELAVYFQAHCSEFCCGAASGADFLYWFVASQFPERALRLLRNAFSLEHGNNRALCTRLFAPALGLSEERPFSLEHADLALLDFILDKIDVIPRPQDMDDSSKWGASFINLWRSQMNESASEGLAWKGWQIAQLFIRHGVDLKTHARRNRKECVKPLRLILKDRILPEAISGEIQQLLRAISMPDE